MASDAIIWWHRWETNHECSFHFFSAILKLGRSSSATRLSLFFQAKVAETSFLPGGSSNSIWAVALRRGQPLFKFALYSCGGGWGCGGGGIGFGICVSILVSTLNMSVIEAKVTSSNQCGRYLWGVSSPCFISLNILVLVVVVVVAVKVVVFMVVGHRQRCCNCKWWGWWS